MIEDYFAQKSVIFRMKNGLMSPYLEDLEILLLKQGYSRDVIKRHMHAYDAFGIWLIQQGISISSVCESVLCRYINTLGRCPNGRLPKNASGLKILLEFLYQNGIIIPSLNHTISKADKWIASFDYYLAHVVGLTKGTRRFYLRYAHRLLKYHFSNKTIYWSLLTAKDISSFVQYESSNLKSSAKRLPVTATRAIIKFLISKDMVKSNLISAIPPIRTWRLASLPQYISPDEVDRLLDICHDDETHTGIRDKAILMLISRLGLRAGETARLCLQDIDWIEGHVLIRAGKNHCERSLPIPQDVGDCIVHYLRNSKRKSSQTAVFLRSRPPFGPLSSSGITNIAERRLKQAGIKATHMGAHVLRHTAATQMVRMGATFKDVADVLGHQNLSTTNIYAKLDLDNLNCVAMPWPRGEK